MSEAVFLLVARTGDKGHPVKADSIAVWRRSRHRMPPHNNHTLVYFLEHVTLNRRGGKDEDYSNVSLASITQYMEPHLQHFDGTAIELKTATLFFSLLGCKSTDQSRNVRRRNDFKTFGLVNSCSRA